MTTEKQIHANKKNAQKSTEPKGIDSIEITSDQEVTYFSNCFNIYVGKMDGVKLIAYYLTLLSISIAYLSISLVISSTSPVKIFEEISTMILFLLKTILT